MLLCVCVCEGGGGEMRGAYITYILLCVYVCECG